MWSGIGGKWNALKARDVGDAGDRVGDDAAEDVWESMAANVVCLFCSEVAEGCNRARFQKDLAQNVRLDG